MDSALFNKGDAITSRQCLKYPRHLKMTHHSYQPFCQQPITSKKYGDEEAADLLSKMNYRVCNDGFYIPSPSTPRPADNLTFTFDDMCPRRTTTNVKHLHLGNTSMIHSPGHDTKNPCMLTEANAHLMESILHQQQQLLSLPSCQYSPRNTPISFTPNIAESIMTEEVTVNYHNIPDINRKSTNESILDDAIDNIDARDEDLDMEQPLPWQAKEEKVNWKQEDSNHISSFVESINKSWIPVDLTTSNHRTRPQTPVASPQTHVASWASFWQMSVLACQREVERKTAQKTQTSEAKVVQGTRTTVVPGVGKRYICDLCGKSFAHSSSIRTHRRTHTGERPYHCGVCGRDFSDLSTLRKHRRTHTGDKPYKCDVCDKYFAQSGNVYRHMRSIHPNEASALKSRSRQTILGNRSSLI